MKKLIADILEEAGYTITSGTITNIIGGQIIVNADNNDFVEIRVPVDKLSVLCQDRKNNIGTKVRIARKDFSIFVGGLNEDVWC